MGSSLSCGHQAVSSTPDASESIEQETPAGTDWWKDAVFYEIFVRSFADSDGDGVGDFVGMTEKLDVLNDGDPSTNTDLGVTGIWLMPIHRSPSYHGYDVLDYRSVNPDYGTLAEFEAFLEAAEARGIRVIIDFVMNHSSVQHPWFTSARTGPDSPYRAFYSWRDTNPGWTQPWGSGPVWHQTSSGYYYGLFWSGMPDLNLANPEVESELVGAMDFWLDKGVAGFRVDAARHFFESEDGVLSDQPESHAFFKSVRRGLAEHPEALYVAEVWTNKRTVNEFYGDGGDEFQLAFGFDTAGAILESANDGTRAGFEQNLRSAASIYDDLAFEAPFLTNHDMPRVMRILGGDPGKMRVAAAALFAVPGTPFVYYGEELGMLGGPSDRDEDKRTPMRWDAAAPNGGFSSATPWHTAQEEDGVSIAAQRDTEGSLWTLYRDLIRLRRTQASLTIGDIELPPREGGGRGGTAVLRSFDGRRVLFVANFDGSASGPMTVDVDGAANRLLGEGLTRVEAEDGGLKVELEAHGFGFLAVD
ncbi:MAG: alpha-amylase family glycosyl hydrolase [Myxococcota bacterium]